MTESTPNHRPRPAVALLLWLVWLPAAAYLAWEPFRWHTAYFRSPGPLFYTAIQLAIPACLVGGWGYLRLRRLWWQWEIRTLAAVSLAVAIGYEPLAALAALALCLAAWAGGLGLLRHFGLDLPPGLQRAVAAVALGFGVLTLALFAIGLAGWGPAPALWIVIAALAGVGAPYARELARDLRAVDQAWRGEPSFSRPLAGIAALGAAALAAPAWLVALAPAVAHDPIVMHLPAARYYASIAALRPVPHLDYSYYPQSFELLMTPLYAVAGQPAAQLLAPVFLALTIAAFAVIARQAGLPRPAAFLGAVVVAAFPFLHWTGAVPKNDLAMQAYLLVALIAFLQGRAAGRRWVLLSIVFVAFAFGVKHIALFGAVALGVLYIVWLRSQPHRLRTALLLAALFAATGLVWHIRTFVLTGNPVYPAMAEFAVEALRPDAMRPEGNVRMAHWRIPWAVHFAGQTAFESPTANPMGLFFVVFWPLALLPVTGRSTAARFALGYALLYLLYWSMIWPVIRYAIAPLGILAVLLAAKVWAVGERPRRAVRAAAQAALALTLLFSLLVIAILEVNGPQLRYFAGQITKDAYLRELLIAYPAVSWLREHVKPGEQAVALNACANAYAPPMSRFTCQNWGEAPAARAFLDRAAQPGAWTYLLLPNNALGAPLAPAGGSVVYRDDEFVVYRAGATAASP